MTLKWTLVGIFLYRKFLRQGFCYIASLNLIIKALRLNLSCCKQYSKQKRRGYCCSKCSWWTHPRSNWNFWVYLNFSYRSLNLVNWSSQIFEDVFKEFDFIWVWFSFSIDLLHILKSKFVYSTTLDVWDNNSNKFIRVLLDIKPCSDSFINSHCKYWMTVDNSMLSRDDDFTRSRSFPTNTFGAFNH